MESVTAPDETVVHIIETVAAREDVSPNELAPLTQAVDPDAIEAFVSPDRAGPRGAANRSARLTFEYTGYTVTVDADGVVTVAQ
jgi:hypothetical protein